MPRIEALLLSATFVLYSAGFALALFGIVRGSDRPLSLGRSAAALGFAAHTGALATRWIVSGHFPLATPYENACLAAWTILLLTFVAPRRWATFRAAGVGAIALALVILGWAAVTQDAVPGPMGAALRSWWLVVHVLFAMLAYGAFSVASGAAAGYLLKARGGDAGVLARMPPLEALDELGFRYVVFGFVTCAVMIASGSIWAKDLWGAYWSWDPVETWNLVAWLAYGVLIHLRVTFGWTGRRFAWFALLAVALIVIAYFGVAFFVGASEHVFTIPEARG
jgi:cytochrome c-type biogenesis protein CcsB